jgi:hypothetical protein
MILPRHRGGMRGRSSGYCTVTRFRNMTAKTVQSDLRRLIIASLTGKTEDRDAVLLLPRP